MEARKLDCLAYFLNRNDVKFIGTGAADNPRVDKWRGSLK